MSAHVGAVQEGHSKLDAAFLRWVEQALPDTKSAPADEGLSRPPPRPQFRGRSTPFGSILMAPEDSLILIRRDIALHWFSTPHVSVIRKMLPTNGMTIIQFRTPSHPHQG
jgi:hypothetical protein